MLIFAQLVLAIVGPHLVILASGLEPQQAGNQPCSRRLSALVREVVRSDVLPIVLPRALNTNGRITAVPEQCLLYPDNDMFSDQELHKTVTGGGLHKCLYCNKTFKSDAYLNAHMDRKHEDELRGVQDSAGRPSARFCLADAAPVLGLPSSSAFFHTAPEAIEPGTLVTDPGCSERVVERLMHRCRSIARSCFPQMSSPLGTADRDALSLFEEEVCARIRCQGGVVRGIASTDAVVAALRGESSAASFAPPYLSAPSQLAAVLSGEPDQQGLKSKESVLIFSATALCIAGVVIGTAIYVLNRPRVLNSLRLMLSPASLSLGEAGRGIGGSSSGNNSSSNMGRGAPGSNSQQRASRLAGAAPPRGSLLRLLRDVREALAVDGKKRR